MEKLVIKSTLETPEIIFDFANNHYCINGASVPENALSFYAKLTDSMNKYYNENKVKEVAQVDINLSYFNSASTKMILFFFENLGKLAKRHNANFNVNWKLANEEEEDIIDFIEIIESMTNIKINRVFGARD